MDGIENSIATVCCFCNEEIESSKVDPADLIIRLNFDKPDDVQEHQALFCHLRCFREQLHDSVKMHFHLHNILDD